MSSKLPYSVYVAVLELHQVKTEGQRVSLAGLAVGLSRP